MINQLSQKNLKEENKTERLTAVAVAQPPFFKNKIVNYKKTTSFKLI